MAVNREASRVSRVLRGLTSSAFGAESPELISDPTPLVHECYLLRFRIVIMPATRAFVFHELRVQPIAFFLYCFEAAKETALSARWAHLFEDVYTCGN